MKVLFILASLVTIARGDRCNGVTVNDRSYKVDIIKDGVNHLSNLFYNRNEDAIYFIFEDVLGKIPSRVLGHIDMSTHKATVVQGIRNASAIAIDHFSNKVYVGGADGLFKINEKYVPEQLPVQDDVIDVYFKDVLYFINRRNQVFRFEDGQSTPVQELRGIEVDKLIIDNDNNVFYTRGKDLFRIKLGTRAINTHEGLKVEAIATDAYNKAVVCTTDGLYGYNKFKFVFDKQANLKGLRAITFNRVNEAIYAVADYIVKLSLSSIACFGD